MKMDELVEYKEFRIMRAGQLEPHKDAILPTGDDDRESLDDNIKENGPAVCLVISAVPDKATGLYQIHDGITRWKAVIDQEGPEGKIPCNLAVVKDAKKFALICMSIGRKRSTGQRIMAFLEMHRKEVLKVAAMVAGQGRMSQQIRSRAGHVTGTVITGVLANFTAEAIAAKLHVSDKDVRLGIELLQCIEQKLTASWDRGGIHVAGEPLDMEKDDGKDYLKALKKVHLGLLAGSTPIRRWKPAVGGLAKTEDRQRPEINYGKLGYNAILTIKNAIKHWDKVSSTDKQSIARVWEELREAAAKVHLD
ncbi:MAG TPA: hypothetical protein PKC67_02455 [Kiritimatiellia bacterium]|nr:hypothetical protein [Kiritimatiellia bacterium]HMP33187.1 hypothetical protein [Kiritimatiellia bacterium]